MWPRRSVPRDCDPDSARDCPPRIGVHYFSAHLGGRGRELPGYVQREFDDYLKCGRLEHGFLRLRCEWCDAKHLVAFRCKRRGFCPSCGEQLLGRRCGGRRPDASTAGAFHRLPDRCGAPFTLQTLSACDPEDQFGNTVGEVAGFSLHAEVAARADERKKLERPCRYISRPAVSEAQCLKRVFPIDIEICRECGGAVQVIAYIEDPVVIRKIRDHLKEKSEYRMRFGFPSAAARHPPQMRLIDEGKSVRESQESVTPGKGRARPPVQMVQVTGPKSSPCLGLSRRTSRD